jgi:hypothetical protein
MAVPTVTNIYPPRGHAGGKALVRILGGGFAENVSVTFGGVEARDVRYVNHALLYVVTPISPLQDATTGAGDGDVDVVIQNLDEDGNPVGGESVTVTDGFEYRMPSFAAKSTLERISLRLREELRRQVWREVILRRHTDYSRDAAAIQVEFSTLPALALIGPQIVPNPVYKRNTKTLVQGERFLVNRQAPLTVDLQFGIVGGWNKDRHGFGLTEATMGFFKKNTRLQVDKVEGDPSQGHVLFDMDFTPGNLPTIVAAPNESNVSAFSGTVAIIGVILEGFSTIDELPESDFFDELVGPAPVVSITTLEIES